MSEDPSARLRGANPVPGVVPAPPIDPILKRLREEARDGAVPAPDSDPRPAGAARTRWLSSGIIALGVVPVAIVVVLLTGALGSDKAPRGASAAAGLQRCRPALIHRGAPPAWASAGFSGGFKVPYALASGDSALAFFFAHPLRAGHPANPYNKVLWVLRSTGSPLLITARSAVDPAVSVRIRPAAAAPAGDFPSYVNLPRAGCWTLDLTWGPHRASVDVDVRAKRS